MQKWAMQPTERTVGGAPREKALCYARDIARNKGTELPEEVKTSASACRNWLDEQLKITTEKGRKK
jgi:hypothetical protein